MPPSLASLPPPLPRRLQAPLRLAVLTASLLLVGSLAGCASQKKAQDQQPNEAKSAPEPPPRPGSERWMEAADRLPNRAPMVQVFRVGRLLETGRSLYDWLVADPDMYGNKGKQYVQRAQNLWANLQRRLGFDPLAAETPGEIGFDGSRPLLLAAHPAGATGGEQSIEDFEQKIRELGDAEASTDLRALVESMATGDRDLPSGLHTRLADTLEISKWRTGFRLLVPVAEKTTLLETAENVFSALEYEPMPAGRLADSEDQIVRAYHRRQSARPAVLVRIDEDWATVDLLSNPYLEPAVGPDEAADHYRSALEDLTDDSGRPTAPAPPDEPAAAVAVDQQGMMQLTKLRGYGRAVARAASNDVERRDSVFVEHLREATKSAHTWSVAAERLTGTTLSFHGRDAPDGDRLFHVAVDLFGPLPETPVEVSAAGRTLDVENRAFGLSLDFAPIFSEGWHEWLGVETSELPTRAPTSGASTRLRMLSWPRQLALLVTNAGRLITDDEEWFEPLAPHRAALRRVEIATSGSQVHALRGSPSVVGLLDLDPDAEEETIQEILRGLPAAVDRLVRKSNSEANGASETPELPALRDDDEEVEKPPLDRGELERLGDEDSDGPSVFYYVPPAGESPYVLFSFGVPEESVRDELKALDSGEKTKREDVAYARVEPATLFAALTTFDQDAFAPLDVGIVSQRIGPLEFNVRPVRSDEFQRLEIGLTLRPPPQL